jgi:hypothetical protein
MIEANSDVKMDVVVAVYSADARGSPKGLFTTHELLLGISLTAGP